MQGTFVPPRRRFDLILEILDHEAILYVKDSGQTHRMNKNAFDIWQHCDGKRSFLELANRQTEISDIDMDTAIDDIKQLVALFAESGLLETKG